MLLYQLVQLLTQLVREGIAPTALFAQLVREGIAPVREGIAPVLLVAQLGEGDFQAHPSMMYGAF